MLLQGGPIVDDHESNNNNKGKQVLKDDFKNRHPLLGTSRLV